MSRCFAVCWCSAAQSCPTLCDPTDCSTPGFPVPLYLPELAQTRVHRVGDAIPPSPLYVWTAFGLSIHLGLFHTEAVSLTLAIVDNAAVNTGMHIYVSFLLDIYAKRSCWITWSSGWFFEELLYCFPQQLFQQRTRVLISLHPRQHLLSLVFHNILMSVQWYLTSVLTGISLTTSDVEHSSCAYWPLVCLLWRHSYLSSLSIENSGWLFVVVAAEM